jgi:hypothetical protein
MGYQKIEKKPLTTMGIVKIIIIGVIIFGGFCSLFVFTIEQENKFAREQAIIEAAYIHPDTLYISRDLHTEDNLVRFINDEYPLYKILEYKHIDSEYSAWNGAHNFYEFILIKK